MDGIVLHDGRRVWGEVHVDREVGTPRLEVLYPAARDPETVVQVYPLETSALHKMVDGSVRYQFTVVQFQFPELSLARVAATQIPQPLVTDPLAVT